MMAEDGKSDLCMWVCWGVGALAGLFAVLQVGGAFPVLATLMFGGLLCVLVYVSVSRMICTGQGFSKALERAVGPETEMAGLAAGTEPAPMAPPAPVKATVAEAASVAPPADTSQPARKPSVPGALAAARKGGADNLKKIKGIGPKLEALCHELGIYHFDQIAAWTAADVAWMDDHLDGFRGRVSRDEWVAQARDLAKAEARAPEHEKSNDDGASKRTATQGNHSGG